MSRVVKRKPSVLGFSVPGQYSGNDLRLQLPKTAAQLAEVQDHTYSYLEYLEEHFDFRSLSEPWQWVAQDKLLSASQTDIVFVNITFPNLRNRETILAMSAWFSFLFTVDDVVEEMDEVTARRALLNSIDLLMEDFKPHQAGVRHRTSLTDTPSSRVNHVTRTFCKHLQSLLSEETYRRVTQSICSVLSGMVTETQYRAKDSMPPSIEEYMKVRARTIGTIPFMVLLESEVLPVDHIKSSALRALEKEINMIIGLQNDVLGLEKDLREGCTMNFVVVASGFQSTQPMTIEMQRSVETAVAKLVGVHNEKLQLSNRLRKALRNKEDDLGESDVAESLYLLSASHFYWASAARRYRVSYSE